MKTRTIQSFNSRGVTRRPNTRVGVRNEEELVRHAIAALKAGESVIITNGFPETRWSGGGQSCPARNVHDVAEFCEQGVDVATLAENKFGITPEELSAQFLNEVFYATTGGVIPVELRIAKGLPMFDPVMVMPEPPKSERVDAQLKSNREWAAGLDDLAERLTIHASDDVLEKLATLSPRDRQEFARRVTSAASDLLEARHAATLGPVDGPRAILEMWADAGDETPVTEKEAV